MPKVFFQLFYLIMRKVMIFRMMPKVLKTLLHLIFADTRAQATFAQIAAKDILYLVDFMIGKTATRAELVKRFSKLVF